MKSVGIRELKAKLSRYLEEVKVGEVVWVTDRGKVVAELRSPGSGDLVPRDSFEGRMMNWVRDGRASLGLPNRPSLYRRSPLRSPKGTAERLLQELRGER